MEEDVVSHAGTSSSSSRPASMRIALAQGYFYCTGIRPKCLENLECGGRDAPDVDLFERRMLPGKAPGRRRRLDELVGASRCPGVRSRPITGDLGGGAARLASCILRDKSKLATTASTPSSSARSGPSRSPRRRRCSRTSGKVAADLSDPNDDALDPPAVRGDDRAVRPRHHAPRKLLTDGGASLRSGLGVADLIVPGLSGRSSPGDRRHRSAAYVPIWRIKRTPRQAPDGEAPLAARRRLRADGTRHPRRADPQPGNRSWRSPTSSPTPISVEFALVLRAAEPRPFPRGELPRPERGGPASSS